MSKNLRAIWTRRLLLGANLASPVLLIATGFQIPWLIAGAVAAHACFAYAVVKPDCGWFGPVVTRFRPDGREVWLTIDDGPAGPETERLAEAMRQRGVRATFFVQGSRLAEQPEAAARLHAAGCTLANHTQTHPAHRFCWLRPAGLRWELDACGEALARAGVSVRRWFRSPVGLKSVRLHPELARRGMRLIGWSVRGRDGVSSDPESVVRRVIGGVKPGAIIVLHEGKPRSVEGILRVIDELQQRGYAFVIPEDHQLI